MAITIHTDSSDVLSVAEYMAYVSAKVNLADTDSVLASAPMLRALANDRQLFVRRLNELVENAFTRDTFSSAQSILLGTGKDFYVRANVWPSTADVAGGRLYQDQLAYNIAHDHNFSFLTVSYLGTGYETDIYEYDYNKVVGYPGEAVDLRFLEHARFAAGQVMYYRACRDAHIQYPPTEMTLSLNLMIRSPEIRMRDQYFFDLEKKTLLGYLPETDSARRADMLMIAGQLGDGRTQELLNDLSIRHPSRSTRLAALESLSQLAPAEAQRIWERGCDDQSALVAQTSRQKLRALS